MERTLVAWWLGATEMLALGSTVFLLSGNQLVEKSNKDAFPLF